MGYERVSGHSGVYLSSFGVGEPTEREREKYGLNDPSTLEGLNEAIGNLSRSPLVERFGLHDSGEWAEKLDRLIHARARLLGDQYKLQSVQSGPLREHLQAHLNEIALGSRIDTQLFGGVERLIVGAEELFVKGFKGLMEQGVNYPAKIADVDVVARFLPSHTLINDVDVGASSLGGRVVIHVQSKQAIGWEGITDLGFNRPSITVDRIEGNRSEAVRVVDGTKPPTHEMFIIGGPYGPTGKFGLYTLYSGRYAPPTTDTAFWSSRAFLTGESGPSWSGLNTVRAGSNLATMMSLGKIAMIK